MQAFFESESFEDAIRNAISIGGDSDTLAAITGGIAEAYYGIPTEIRKHALTFLDERLMKILVAFESAVVETVKDNDFVPFTFGKIGGKTRAAKTCRNPQTGETMEVPEKVGYPYAKFSSTIK